MPPRFSWKQGDPRRTPKGTRLEGVYPISYWCSNLTKEWVSSKRMNLETFLASAIDGMHRHRRYILNLRRSKGEIELFIGIGSSKNFGFELTADLQQKAAKAGIALSFDIYPE